MTREQDYMADQIPDLQAIEEARFISAQTRIQDEKEAKELGMSLEEFYQVYL